MRDGSWEPWLALRQTGLIASARDEREERWQSRTANGPPRLPKGRATSSRRSPLRRGCHCPRPLPRRRSSGRSRMLPLAGAIIGTLTARSLSWPSAIGLPATAGGGRGAGRSGLDHRRLHEDGLADLADGFGGGSSRERKLAIMRDSRIGSFGVLTLLFVVLARCWRSARPVRCQPARGRRADHRRRALAAGTGAAAPSAAAGAARGMSYRIGCPTRRQRRGGASMLWPRRPARLAIARPAPCSSPACRRAAYWASRRCRAVTLAARPGMRPERRSRSSKLTVLLAFAAKSPRHVDVCADGVLSAISECRKRSRPCRIRHCCDSPAHTICHGNRKIAFDGFAVHDCLQPDRYRDALRQGLRAGSRIPAIASAVAEPAARSRAGST